MSREDWDPWFPEDDADAEDARELAEERMERRAWELLIDEGEAPTED